MTTSSSEFRQMQRERICKTKPWLKATGPKTVEGKEKSKMNALRVNPELYSLTKEMKYLIKQQKEIWNTVSNKTSIDLK